MVAMPDDMYDGVVARLAKTLEDSPSATSGASLERYLSGDWTARCPIASFDARFYLSHLPVQLARAISPLKHYLLLGFAAGLPPHPCFDLDFWYAPKGPDVPHAASQPIAVPALLELLEARRPPYSSPNVLFDAQLYVRMLPSGALGQLAPFEHFLQAWPDYRVPFSRYFDAEFYLLRNPHVAKAGLNPLAHYCSQPIEARSDPNPMIHGKYYAGRHVEVRGDPLVHYLRFGMKAGCMPNPYAEKELRAGCTGYSPHFDELLLSDYVAIPV